MTGKVVLFSLGGKRVRISDIATRRRETFIAPLIRTALWNPIDPLINLLSMIGWITAPE
jgi:hypothetical protein